MNDRLALVFSAALLIFSASRGRAGTDRFVVRSWTSEDGLPSNTIRAVAQADNGYLWVATAEGVVRFDGVRFSHFPEEANGPLAERNPRALFALPGGDVWIATGGGGLLRWDRRRFASVWDDAEGPVAANRLVSQVAGDGAAGAYIERGAELFHAVGDAAPRQIERTPEVAEKVREAVTAQWQHGSTASPEAPLELLDRRGRLWTRTPAGGLEVAETPGTSEPVALPELGAGSRITALLEDRERNLWVATNGNGLFEIRPRRVDVIDTPDGLSDHTALAVLEDRAGILWVANKGGGVDRIERGQVAHSQVDSGDATRPISALCEDRAGTLWAARRNSNLYRWRDGGFQAASGAAMPIWRVTAMAEDRAGRLWLGDEHGLASWAEGVLTRYGREHGLPATQITVLAGDASGGLWVGTGQGTLYHGQAGAFTKTGALSSRAVSGLLAEEDGTLWATTLGSGLYRWKAGQLSRFSEPEGLPDDRLTCVLDDGAGALWLGSLAGIFRVEKKGLAEIAGRRRAAAEWLQLGRADGLLSGECIGSAQPSGWRGRDGTLWFPTVKGVASVRPATFVLNKVAPPVVIEEARADGHAPALDGATLSAGPGRSRLEIRYTALSFSSAERVRLRTRLDGLDNEWREAGTQRTVAYEAVPPGRYRFRVLAENADGLWNETGAALAIVVTPHFWETLSFRIAAGLCAVAAALGIGATVSRARWRGRLLRLEAQTSREKERARIAQDLHDDLGASLTEISLLAQLAAEDENPERDALPEIATKARRIVGTFDEIVWAANPRHDTVASLAEYLAASAAELLEVAGLPLRLEIPAVLPSLPLAPEQRHGLYLAVREALNNVVKHAAATEVWLCFEAVAGELRIVLRDNGGGLSAEVGEFSEGLRNMRARLAGIGGVCRIESGPEGTRVSFAIPLAKLEA